MSGIAWADAELISVSVDYDSVAVRVREALGNAKTLVCGGYIGYSLCGFWDEVVVANARIVESHEAIERCSEALAKRLGSTWPASGNSARNTKQWKALVVRFSDGGSLEVVAVDFRLG